jgi:hypothetical protein
MALTRWILRQVLNRRLRQVAKAQASPAAAQERLLLRFVRRAEETEWGRTHGFAAIRSARDFQRAVPLSRYEDLAPLWHRAFDGARNVTWPGHIRYFATTSGTTTGRTKYLPVSREALRANVRSGMTLLALIGRQAPDADLIGGKTLYFGSSTHIERHGACWEGDSSGINARHVPRFAWRYRLPEPDVASIQDWAQRLEAVCQAYLDSPVRAVVGLPAWTLTLFRRLVDVARERGRSVSTVGEVWPGLRAYVHFGMAFEPYREQFKELVGRPIAFIDSYSSTEGGMNAIQCDPSDPSMQLELDSCAFYEFVPFTEYGRPEAPRLTLDQVETGVDYALLLSTPAGIWAYDVGDVVRFTSLRPPKIVFAGRTRLTLSAFGEHLTGEVIDHSIAEAAKAVGAAIRDFTVTGVPPAAAEPRGHHLWLVEFEGPMPPLDALTAELDKSIRAANLDYDVYRTVTIDTPELVALAPGTFYEWARRHGAVGGQHKVPRVARSSDMVEELLAISKSLDRANEHGQ